MEKIYATGYPTLPRWARSLVNVSPVVAFFLWTVHTMREQGRSYSRFSATTAEAREAGTLVYQPVLPESTFTSSHATYRVNDLFVESVTHVVYDNWIWRRVVTDPGFRLVVNITPHPSPAEGQAPFVRRGGGLVLLWGGSHSLLSSQDVGDALVMIDRAVKPFPDTITFRLEPRR